MKHKYIVGLNVGNHDSAAALLVDGKLVHFVEQERFSRKKMALGEAPVDALKYCLDMERIGIRDVEAIAVGMDWKYRKEVYQEPLEESSKYTQFNDPDWFLPKSMFGNYRPPIYVIRHHLAHAASAYRISGFDNSAVLVVDNRGEDASSSLGIAEHGKITFFKQINIQNSLGIFYNRACRYTGLYGKYREVGKFMGLASYGIPNMKIPLNSSREGLLFKDLPNIEHMSVYESIQCRTEQLKEYFNKNCFPFDAGNIDEIMSYANFAASVQKAMEDVLLDFVLELKEKTKSDNLVISGGVALNCSANGKIAQSGLFKHIYVPPFASDSGTAAGAALELNYQLHNNIRILRPLHNANLGAAYNDSQIEKTLNNCLGKVKWEKISDDYLYKKIAKKIASGKIVAWMQEGFEAGPRALGYRSILADPRERKSLIRLNIIKQREMWRPIAPSVLKEKYECYFEGSPEDKYFMNVAAIVKKEVQSKIPAVVHVDQTARPQVVDVFHTKYYRLINSFFEETGIPVLCNTSFNLKGMPLVNTPKDAIECYLQSDIDLLVMNNYIVYKERNI